MTALSLLRPIYGLSSKLAIAGDKGRSQLVACLAHSKCGTSFINQVHKPRGVRVYRLILLNISVTVGKHAGSGSHGSHLPFLAVFETCIDAKSSRYRSVRGFVFMGLLSISTNRMQPCTNFREWNRASLLSAHLCVCAYLCVSVCMPNLNLSHRRGTKGSWNPARARSRTS